MPRYYIQGNLVQCCPTSNVTMPITCRACTVTYQITGADIPCDEGTNLMGSDVESSIDQTLSKMGWNDCICNYCQDLDHNIVKTYNDTIDRHDED